jgi:hypothetical protein
MVASYETLPNSIKFFLSCISKQCCGHCMIWCMSCMGSQGACNGTRWIIFQHCPALVHHNAQVLSSALLTVSVPWTLHFFLNLVDLGLLLLILIMSLPILRVVVTMRGQSIW